MRGGTVRRLEAERHPRIAGLVQREERHRESAGALRILRFALGERPSFAGAAERPR